MRHPWPCAALAGYCLFGLATCSQPEVLRRPLPEPTSHADFGDGLKAPLPAVAVPTGEPPVVRESGASGSDVPATPLAPGSPPRLQ